MNQKDQINDEEEKQGTGQKNARAAELETERPEGETAERRCMEVRRGTGVCVLHKRRESGSICPLSGGGS